MNIIEYAHLSENGTDWTRAFAAACECLKQRGGGELFVPAGNYPTGSVRLYGNTTLRLENGATLLFHQSESAYPLIPLEFEGDRKLMHQACVFAENAENVRITGDGAIDGQGAFWWDKVKNRSLEHSRPYLVCFSNCAHVTIENVTLKNSPCWTVHPLRCDDVSIRGLRIKNPPDSPNTDGINPDACRDVRISDCVIDVGDDCIAIKSGTQHTPDRRACERIIITNCHFLHGHGGIVIGSEMSGGVRNVLVSDCVFYETDRGVRLKTRRGRGGAVEGIQLFNLVMERVICPFVFNMYYFCGDEGKAKRVWDKNPYPVDDGTPALRDVFISGVTCRDCGACAGYFYGLAEMPVERITLRDVTVEMDANAEPGRPAMMEGCSDMRARGFIIRNARGVKLAGVSVIGAEGDEVDLDDTAQVEIS